MIKPDCIEREPRDEDRVRNVKSKVEEFRFSKSIKGEAPLNCHRLIFA